MSLLRLGFVGHGAWGTRLHAAFVREQRVGEWFVHDRDPSRLEALPARARVPSFEALLDLDLHALVFALDPRDQPDLAVRAFERGLHVFLEKPLALDVAGAARVAHAARASGKISSVGHVVRYHPAVVRGIERIERGEIGALRGAVIERRGARPRPFVPPWWVLAPHDFSVLGHFGVGEPTWLDGAGDLDARRVRFRYENDLSVDLSVSGGSDARRVTAWLGTGGMLVVDEARASLRLVRSASFAARAIQRLRAGVGVELDELLAELATRTAEETTCPGDALEAEVRAFLDAIESGVPVRTDVDEGQRVVRALVAGATCGKTTSLISPRAVSTSKTPCTGKAS